MLHILFYSFCGIDANSEDKKAFNSFCKDIGINTSSAINIFIKTVIRENKITFIIVNYPFYSKSNVDFLKEGIKALNEGKGISHELIEENETLEFIFHS